MLSLITHAEYEGADVEIAFVGYAVFFSAIITTFITCMGIWA